jgi:DNA anti-recombination protein RmuC
MGRKSNTVITKHFTRGKKLQDLSNRYQYTCKRCGEHFPKGRIESLYNHVVNKCTALSINQKHGINLQLQQISDAARATAAARNQRKVETSQKIGLSLPQPQKQDCARLNALAEVSHQRAATQHSYTPFLATGNGGNFGPMVLDPALENAGLSNGFYAEVENDLDESARQNGELLVTLLLV